MGSSSSKTVGSSTTSRTVKEVRKQDPTITPDEIKACETAIHEMLDEQLDAMKEEVKEVDEIITDDVINTIKSIEDSLLLQYEQLSRYVQNRNKYPTGVQRISSTRCPYRRCNQYDSSNAGYR